jgi:hypothetical protein
MSNSKLYLGSIDLNKIDKSQVDVLNKDGEPFKNGAKYLSIAVWVNEEADQYGNHVSISYGGKDNKTYIGNCKEYQAKQGEAEREKQPHKEENDLPF